MPIKKLYIIPGCGSTCEESPYKKLTKKLKTKGYTVIPINPNWKKPLLEQSFEVEKNSMIVGFSFGAVIACLIAKKIRLQKIILASLSPVHKYSYKELYKDNKKFMSEIEAVVCAKDIKKIKINLKNLKSHVVTLAGDREKLRADLLVPNTDHYLNNAYIKVIIGCL